VTEIRSPNFYPGRTATIRLVVLHTMEVDENAANAAEAVGAAFANPARQASSHVGIDVDSEVRYVQDRDTAWAAPGANSDGLQLEMAGRAGQTTGDWADAASGAILERAAQRVASWCATYSIPVVHLSDADLAAGRRGIVGHDAVSRVYKKSSHWDPGPNFPYDRFLARVAAIGGVVLASNPINTPQAPTVTLAPLTPLAPITGDDDMRIIQETTRGIAVVGPGYYHSITPEELPYALEIWGNPTVLGSAREFDLVRAVATNRTA